MSKYNFNTAFNNYKEYLCFRYNSILRVSLAKLKKK